MPLSNPGDVLWHSKFKINCQSRGFTFKAHYAAVTEAVARANATDLALRLRKLMPTSANLFFATISKDDTRRDSRFLPGAVGDGEYVVAPATESAHDYSKVAVLVRFEHAAGSSVTRKVNPIPDVIITAGDVIPDVTDVVGVPATVPAVGAADWQTEFTNFMKAFVKNTHHILSNHVPGGQFTYETWENAFVIRVGDKKGGRDFV